MTSNCTAVAALVLTAAAAAACTQTREVEVIKEVEVPAPPGPLDGLHAVTLASDVILQTQAYVDGARPGIARDCLHLYCTSADGSVIHSPLSFAGTITYNGIEDDRVVAGLPIVESRSEDGNLVDWGSWMDYSAFLVSLYYYLSEDGTREGHEAYGTVFGVASEEPLPPEGTATWRGAMLGTDIITLDRYAGNATLVATFRDVSEMDVSFTDIANVETGDAREDITFPRTGLYLNLDGTHRFLSWEPGDVAYGEASIYIDGYLFGPNHEEATGVFGYSDLVGVFGAQKQE